VGVETLRSRRGGRTIRRAVERRRRSGRHPGSLPTLCSTRRSSPWCLIGAIASQHHQHDPQRECAFIGQLGDVRSQDRSRAAKSTLAMRSAGGSPASTSTSGQEPAARTYSGPRLDVATDGADTDTGRRRRPSPAQTTGAIVSSGIAAGVRCRSSSRISGPSPAQGPRRMCSSAGSSTGVPVRERQQPRAGSEKRADSQATAKFGTSSPP